MISLSDVNSTDSEISLIDALILLIIYLSEGKEYCTVIFKIMIIIQIIV